MESETIVQLVGQLGVAGVLAWYLYHTTTKTIPDLTQRHNESMEKIATKFSDTLRLTIDDERKARDKEVESERRAREKEVAALQSALPKICMFREAK